MTRITNMCGDLQAESSGWLFKSPLAGGGAFCGGPIQAVLLVKFGTMTATIHWFVLIVYWLFIRLVEALKLTLFSDSFAS